jgi:6-phosphogluconate dehydrogenase
MQSEIAVIGLAVMGSNLARNIESRGFRVSVFNRSAEVTKKFASDFGSGNFEISYELVDLVKSLKKPRKIIILVKAGAATDAVINNLIPLLDADDIIIDGGNAYFKDTIRREQACKEKGLRFVGLGVSGGEEGALKGPSLMPGGQAEAVQELMPILQKIAAQVDGPCTDYIGPDGAGHFVKMVHNGIEYADMQMIAEAYNILREVGGLKPEQLAALFSAWNEGPLSSYLIEITAKIFGIKDDLADGALVDKILDQAEQKGTGKWTVQEALDLGVAIPSIAAAVDARVLSSLKVERVSASKFLSSGSEQSSACSDCCSSEQLTSKVHDALYAAKIIAYAQGMAMLKTASETYKWNLNLGRVAAIWKGGCIIRARFLDQIRQAYDQANSSNLANLMLSPFMMSELNRTIGSLRSVTAGALEQGIATPAFSSALSYYDSYRTANLPQNLTQAQRDFFGAHTYQRTDREGVFHSNW